LSVHGSSREPKNCRSPSSVPLQANRADAVCRRRIRRHVCCLLFASFDSAVGVQFYPFEHLRGIVTAGRPVSVRGLLIDALWLFLPALIVLTARCQARERSSAPLLLMAVAPLLVVNISRLTHVRDGGMGQGWRTGCRLPTRRRSWFTRLR
jgi:hypothetical protein